MTGGLEREVESGERGPTPGKPVGVHEVQVYRIDLGVKGMG